MLTLPLSGRARSAFYRDRVAVLSPWRTGPARWPALNLSGLYGLDSWTDGAGNLRADRYSLTRSPSPSPERVDWSLTDLDNWARGLALDSDTTEDNRGPGDWADPTEWATRVDFDTADLLAAANLFADPAHWSGPLPVGAIVSSDDRGFRYVTFYDSATELESAWADVCADFEADRLAGEAEYVAEFCEPGACEPCPRCDSYTCGGCAGPDTGCHHATGCALDWIG